MTRTRIRRWPSATCPFAPRWPARSCPGYEILEELGRGGMGVVYRARQLRLNRIVALKTILAGDHATPEAAIRFLAEAEAVARLHHPNIVQIFAFGEHEGRPYFEMEYVPGGSLAGRLERPGVAATGRGAAGRDARPGDPRGAPPGDRPSRPETGQHPALRRRQPQDRRFRPREVARRRDRPHAKPVDRRLASLHGAGAGRRHRTRGRTRGRRLLARGDPLRAAHRPPALPGPHGARDPGTGQVGRAGHPHADAAETAARRGDDLPQVPGEGSGQAVRRARTSWPRSCAGSARARRSRHDPSAGRRSSGDGAAASRRSRSWR